MSWTMYWALLVLPLAWAIPTPIITPLSPSGLRWEIPDAGYDLVAVHFSVNADLPGVQAGHYNVDIPNKQGSSWVYVQNGVTVHPGDTVHYWLYALASGRPSQDLNQVWTYSGQNTQAPVTQAPVTQAPVTQAPVTHAPANHPKTEAATQKTPSSGHNIDSVSFNAVQKDCDDSPVCTSYPCLIFDDEFDTLNLKTWEHEITAGGGGNWEFQYYTNNRTNSYVKNGVLYLKPTLTSDQYGLNFLEHGKLELWGAGPHDTCTGNQFYGCERQGIPGRVVNPIQSAKLRSSRGFNFKYGKVEIEAKLPTGDWLWPAIWMMPTYDAYGGWPASGEIDIMESRGNLHYTESNGQSQGVNHMGSTIHFGPDWTHDRWDLGHAERDSKHGTFGDSFHKYGLEWDENNMKFFLDGELILTVDPGKDGFWKYGGYDKTHFNNPWAGASKMAPFDQEFYIILNVAVGGQNYFSDNLVNAAYPKPWKDADSTAFWNARNLWTPTWKPTQNNGEGAALQVNYIKVWKLKP
ncbi:LOW QUALITY PROTEIN: beta-1,3-glucan-binding protein-like [Haliotis rubra]|uniref:LOW QUALITY PROTEIN: beta-1,3-glucan-binding protein-like n=1 Tax=Haliotis rubra TaxID=36100 RepID=UPI001EE58D2D|nr:LOW QUALITY PROTEIN: beta-1,3-glucan-binding protein-like [Haliotis rubra]